LIKEVIIPENPYLRVAQAVGHSDDSLRLAYMRQSQGIVIAAVAVMGVQQLWQDVLADLSTQIACLSISSNPGDIAESIKLGVQYEQDLQRKEDHISTWQRLTNSEQKQAEANNQQRATNLRMMHSMEGTFSAIIQACRM